MMLALAAAAVTLLVLLALVLAGALGWGSALAAFLAIAALGLLAAWHLTRLALADARQRLARSGEAERQELQQAGRPAEAMIEALPDPVMLLAADRTIMRANAAAAGLFGVALVGHDVTVAIRHPAALEAIDAVLAGRAARHEVELGLPPPRARDLIARIAPIGGSPRAALVALHDLTAVKRAEQMRADFVANASHELRTPLATLIGFIETLRGPARDDAEAQARFLGIMHEQAQRMARLIRDLLSLSQIELNEHTPPQGTLDLRALVAGVADMLQIQAAEKGMTIEIEAAAGLPPAIGEHDELVQVFQNLIDNAIKYGRRGTTVGVVVSQRSGGLSVAVRDRGEGIAREHLPRLTERFYRVDSARSRALGGTGLGLAIVKHIVSRHRGSLTIDSVPGEGSTFTVFLPAFRLDTPGGRS